MGTACNVSAVCGLRADPKRTKSINHAGFMNVRSRRTRIQFLVNFGLGLLQQFRSFLLFFFGERFCFFLRNLEQPNSIGWLSRFEPRLSIGTMGKPSSARGVLPFLQILVDRGELTESFAAV